MQTVPLVAARQRPALYKRRLRQRQPRQALLELKAGPSSKPGQRSAYIYPQQHQREQQQQLMEWQQPMGWHSQRQGERLQCWARAHALAEPLRLARPAHPPPHRELQQL